MPGRTGGYEAKVRRVSTYVGLDLSSAVAVSRRSDRLEAGEVDARLSTLHRYANAVSRTLDFDLRDEG